MARVSASATIVSARRPAGHNRPEESFWWQDVWALRFGREDWTLELEVSVPGREPYRLTGEWTVPHRTWKLRKSLDGPRRVPLGLVVPVTVDSRDGSKVEIDWTDADMYPREAPEPPAGVPAPTPPSEASLAPIEGVGYDTWIAAVNGIVREKIAVKEHPAYYESHGFPAGRGEAVSARWYERVKADDALREQYVRDTA